MKNLPCFLVGCSVLAAMPIMANAAGTYYNGNYRSPQQQRYNSGTYNTQRANAGYNTGRGNAGVRPNANPRVNVGGQQSQYSGQQYLTKQGQNSNRSATQYADSKTGFRLGAGFSRQVAMWQFEMKDSGSKLHYDNIDWNVFDLNGAYVFNAGNAKFGIDAGFKYGFQSGDSSMIDDDITNGGYLNRRWCESVDANGNCVNWIGDQIGYALSAGSSKGGSLMEFNAGLNWVDAFNVGNVRFTPSVGYRYLQYKLETKNNYGLSIDTAGCVQGENDEIQCNPVVIFYNMDSNDRIIDESFALRDDIKDWLVTPDRQYYSTGDTYYFEQPGTSHSYETTWAGPYLALDMDYLINQNNSVNGRVELGLPSYTATGDQPYRYDWAHPKSVEDKASMGSGFHLGMGANWMTALSDTVMLSIGVTYDYYTVSGADAKTYLSEKYYDELYYERFKVFTGKSDAEINSMTADELAAAESQMLGASGDAIAKNIVALEEQCPGWVCSSGGEVDSFYKSLGVRVGINAKF